MNKLFKRKNVKIKPVSNWEVWQTPSYGTLVVRKDNQKCLWLDEPVEKIKEYLLKSPDWGVAFVDINVPSNAIRIE